MDWAHRYPDFLFKAFVGYSKKSQEEQNKTIDAMDLMIINEDLSGRLLDYLVLTKASPHFLENEKDRKALLDYLGQFINELRESNATH